MLTRRQTGISLRCSSCGTTSLFSISLFTLGSGRREFRCSCGQHVLTVSRRGTDVWTQLACFLCDGVHLFKFSDKNFWSREIKSILCPDTGAEIGYIGPLWHLLKVADMREEILPKMASMISDAAVGLKLLARMLELEDQGRLKCSACDMPLDVEVYSEGIEMSCPACGTIVSVPVGSRSVEASTDEPVPRIDHSNITEFDPSRHTAKPKVGIEPGHAGKKKTRVDPKRRT